MGAERQRWVKSKACSHALLDKRVKGFLLAGDEMLCVMLMKMTQRGQSEDKKIIQKFPKLELISKFKIL